MVHTQFMHLSYKFTDETLVNMSNWTICEAWNKICK